MSRKLTFKERIKSVSLIFAQVFRFLVFHMALTRPHLDVELLSFPMVGTCYSPIVFEEIEFDCQDMPMASSVVVSCLCGPASRRLMESIPSKYASVSCHASMTPPP